jgi:hypothetical protein
MKTKTAQKPTAKVGQAKTQARTAIQSIEKAYNNLDKKQIATYAAVAAGAAVVLYSASRGGLVKGLVASALASTAAKYVADRIPAVQRALA